MRGSGSYHLPEPPEPACHFASIFPEGMIGRRKAASALSHKIRGFSAVRAPAERRTRLAAWPKAVKIQFWRPAKTITFSYMLAIQLGHSSAPAAMGPRWEGLATSLLEPGPGPPVCLRLSRETVSEFETLNSQKLVFF